MRTRKLILISGLLVCGLLGGLWAIPAGAAQANLLANPGFETGFYVQGGTAEVSVGNGWSAWWVQGSQEQVNQGYLVRPEYKGEDANVFGARRVRSGRYSQKYFSSFSTHDAGLMQSVDVPAGAFLEFSAWVQVWSSGGDDPDKVVEPGYYQVSVGIDPTGGTDATADSVVWSAQSYADNVWVHLTVTAQAQGSRVTVFTRGAPQYRVKHNDSYWDDMILRQVSEADTATATPTATPQAEATAEPTATPTATAEPTTELYTVTAGDTLFSIARRFNTTTQALIELNGLSNSDLIYVGQQLKVVASGGSEAPAEEAPAEVETSTYVVQAGDNLSALALRFGTTMESLMELNGLTDPNFIWVGQQLVVRGTVVAEEGDEEAPASETTVSEVTVQAGESLGQIALRYNTTVAALAALNNIVNPNLVYVGQVLKVPGSEPVESDGSIIHVVQAGEILSSIAARYGVTMWEIVEANDLDNINLLWVGQELVIP